jgi:cobalt-zinc-cadmium efflux system outer membrane protein
MKDVRAWAVKGLMALGAILGGHAWAHGQTPGVALLPPTYADAPMAAPMPLGMPQLMAMPPGSKLSLDQMIAMVLASDPRLRVGYEEINLAVSDSITASLRPNPTFSTDGQLLPLTRPFTPIQQGGPPQYDAILSYPIDWFLFGKRKAAMASAGIGIRQTEAEYYDLVRMRIREASSVFFDILEFKALGDVARADVETLTKIEAIKRQALANQGTLVEVNTVRLELLRSQQVLRDAELQLANAKAHLRSLLGRTDGDGGFDVIGTLDLPPLPPPLTADALAIAQENRPDLAALRYKVAKAEADTIVQRRNAFPPIAAKAGWSRQFQGSIGYRDADTYLIGVDIGVPVFDRNQGNRAKAATLLAQSNFELQAGVVDLRAEIEQALNDFRTAQQSAEAVAGQQLKLAQEVRDAIAKANEAGAKPLIDVFDAQRRYRETYKLYVTSRANYWRASVRLNAALGKKVVP